MLSGRTAVIIGAARGIGAATATLFAKSKIDSLILADLNYHEVERLCSSLKNDYNCDCMPFEIDISKEDQIEQLFDKAMDHMKKVDIFVNTAGICNQLPIESINGNEWDALMAINLKGAYLSSRKALEIMKLQKYGKIINLTSLAGRVGGIATGINYATSKGALISMTMSLAKNGGPYGVNVNAIAPGFIDTEMTKDFTHFVPESVPLRRIGTPEDVAYTIEFLCSDKSSYITGATIDINGGVYMG